MEMAISSERVASQPASEPKLGDPTYRGQLTGKGTPSQAVLLASQQENEMGECYICGKEIDMRHECPYCGAIAKHLYDEFRDMTWSKFCSLPDLWNGKCRICGTWSPTNQDCPVCEMKTERDLE